MNICTMKIIKEPYKKYSYDDCDKQYSRKRLKEQSMKTYRDFEKQVIGGSDSAVLTLTGSTNGGVKSEVLHFGSDGYYTAYIVDEPCDIPSHYEKEASFKNWMKIFDDDGQTGTFEATEINVYRAGSFGCIIELKN